MAKKSHLLFRNPTLGTDVFHYTSRFPKNQQEEEEEKVPNYKPMADTFRGSLMSFRAEQVRRTQERNRDLLIPNHITHIDIEFFAMFDAKNYELPYFSNFGLSPVNYYALNTRAVFAIVDETRFGNFINEIERFIKSNGIGQYDRKVIFIKSFRFLTSELILDKLNTDLPVLYLNLIDNSEIFQTAILPIENSLRQYLEQKGQQFFINERTRTLELKGINRGLVTEIVRNFDIIHSVTSSSVSIVGPTRFGALRREPPFSLVSPGEDSLIVGIIDSGISDQTPMAPIIIDAGNDFDVTGGDGKTDNVDHGTGVAAFAVLGDKLIGNPNSRITADARVLSIKVLDTHSGGLTVTEVETLILRAYRNLGVRLFVLCVNYTQNLTTDQSISSYAFLLDKLAYENDILVFISMGNHLFRPDNSIFGRAEVNNYPGQFLDERANICPPAESMNNVSVGALGANREPERLEAITIESLPAIYTRKYHLDDTNQTHLNAKLFKPDVLAPGGNAEFDGNELDLESPSGIQVLSGDVRNLFTRYIGTSFSTPLVANLAVKILNLYPNLRLQTVKALVLNSAEPVVFTDNYVAVSVAKKRFIAGNGTPIESRCLYSDENEVTFVVEDSIVPGNVKAYSLGIPTYLNKLQKNIGLLEVTATMCFKFEPVPNNQVAYCPVHIAFGLAKNVPLRRGNQLLSNDDIIAKGGWSQDAYYKNKMYSNAQKVRFTLSRQELIENNNEFKLVVNCKLHNSLSVVTAARYDHAYDFSIVIRLREQQPEARLTGELYNSIQLVNTLQAVAEADLEGTAEAEV